MCAIRNLNTNVTSSILKAHMEGVGPVAKCHVLRGPFKESHGCGVVVYQQEDHAMRAISELYNSVLNGRLMFVREDREADRGGEGGEQHPSRSVSSPEKGTCVMLGNLNRSVPKLEESIRSFMGQAGPIKRVNLGAQLVGKGRGKILVEYETKAAALKAIADLHGTEINNKKVTVQKYGN
jgi:RNA recognition motif-containing protein